MVTTGKKNQSNTTAKITKTNLRFRVTIREVTIRVVEIVSLILQATTLRLILLSQVVVQTRSIREVANIIMTEFSTNSIIGLIEVCSEYLVVRVRSFDCLAIVSSSYGGS